MCLLALQMRLCATDASSRMEHKPTTPLHPETFDIPFTYTLHYLTVFSTEEGAGPLNVLAILVYKFN